MRIFIFILCMYFIISCKTQETSVIVIDLDKNSPSRDIYLNEWAENIRWITLETRKDILIDGGTEKFYSKTSYWVNDKYIITIGEKNIQLFDIQGNYIRKLADAGKGPKEYQNIDCFTIDNENDILYFIDRKKQDYITCIDLNSGKYKEKIDITKWGSPQHMLVYNGDLICTEGKNYQNDTIYSFYILSPTGQFKQSFKEIMTPNQEKSDRFHDKGRIIPGENNVIEYMTRDTIYKLKFPIPENTCTFIYQNKFEDGINNDGIVLNLLFQTSQEYIITKTNLELERTETGESLALSKPDKIYILNKIDYTLSKSDKFHIFSSDIEVYSIHRMRVNGNNIYTAIDAYEFKEMYEKLLEEDKNTYPEMERLYNQLNEEDNPVLLIGKLK